jgi:hypothetical protein
LLEKLAALMPPPRLNLVRYHGVAPNAADRAQIVPGPEEEVEALAAPTSNGEPTPAQAGTDWLGRCCCRGCSNTLL